ncbi:MAG: zinc-binding dehydrogenase [Candidatus Thorarchaeota archaeon]
MKATVFHEHGGPEVLSYEDFPTPEAKPGQVVIQVKAVALNHLDLFTRKGIPGLKLEMPHILGSDISGVITELGKETSPDLEIGQRVVIDPAVSDGTCEFCVRGEHSLCKVFGIIGEHYRGGYSEYFAVDHGNVLPFPKESGLDYVEAAAVPLTFMTAWRMLKTQARIKAGDDVLIIGIGGAVALAALQIAKNAGARLFVTSSSDTKLEKARLLGADFLINHANTPDYHKEVYQSTQKRGVDVVVDSVGAVTWDRSMKSLRKGGRLVTCGATSGPQAVTNINLLFWKQLELIGSTMASKSELREVLKLIWNKKLRPVVDKIFPLSEARKAHELLEKGEQFGKLVLRP